MKTFTLTSKFTFSSAYRGYTPASPSGTMAPGARTPRLFGERPGTWVSCRWGGRGLGLPRELLTGIPEERVTSPAYASCDGELADCHSEWRPHPCIEPKSHLPALVTRGSAPGGRTGSNPSSSSKGQTCTRTGWPRPCSRSVLCQQNGPVFNFEKYSQNTF